MLARVYSKCAFIRNYLSEFGLQTINENLEGHLIKVMSGEYENIAVGYIGEIPEHQQMCKRVKGGEIWSV